MKKEEYEFVRPKKNRWVTIVIVLLILIVAGYLLAGIIQIFFGSSEFPTNGNVALIPIDGVILTSGGSTFGESVADSTVIVDYIKNAAANPNIRAIIFEINSPGGSGVASEEIADAIANVNKTTVSYIREVGASGAYWIASSTDRIFASRMSITGSIGVTSSYLEYAGLLERFNVTYRRLVSGKYKDMGSPYTQLTAEEQAILQAQLDTVHDFFVQEVAKNRKLAVPQVEQFATGEPILGIKAVEFGLIDEIGGKEEAVKYIEHKYNITADLAEYRQKKTLIDLLTGVLSQSFYQMGSGIGRSLSSQDALSVRT